MRLSCLAVALATLLASASAHAYCRSTTCNVDCERNQEGCKVSGEPLWWPSLCVGFSMQRDGTQWIPMDDVLPIVRAGFAGWSARDCEGGGQSTIAFVELDMVDCHETQHNEDEPNANIIMFQICVGPTRATTTPWPRPRSATTRRRAKSSMPTSRSTTRTTASR